MKSYKLYLASEKENSIHFRPTFYDKKTEDLSNLINLNIDYVFKAYIFDKKMKDMDFVEYGTIRLGFVVNKRAKEFLKSLNLPNYRMFPISVFYGNGNDELLFSEDYDRSDTYEYFLLTNEVIQDDETSTSSKDLYAKQKPNGFYQLYCSEKFKSAYVRKKLTGIIFDEISALTVNDIDTDIVKEVGVSNNYKESNDLFKIVSAWLNDVIIQNHQFSSVKGIYFNVLEMLNGTYAIHVYGTDSFDKSDDEWAIDEDVVLENNFCNLQNTIIDGKTWNEALVIIKESIRKTINQFEFIARSGIGFSDSDIEYFD